MNNWKKNIIREDSTIRQALGTLNENVNIANVLFVVSENGKLLGTLTDGDVRRGFLKDITVGAKVTEVMNREFSRLVAGKIDGDAVQRILDKKINFVPLLDENGVMVDLLNLKEYRSAIPLEAVIMAGGRGERLLPLTRTTPKPMLKVGEKPIIEYSIDRLARHGVKNIHISINYLGHIIEDYFKDGSEKGLDIKYIREDRPLGTIGSLTLAEPFQHQTILIMNSDLLTNIDFGHFYNEFIQSGADMAVAAVPHHVDLPYAILELDEDRVISLQEKPRYTYFANAGIYLIKKELLDYIPKDGHFNATDLMEKVLTEKKKLINYAILEYWLDIGRMSDFQKAQEDIKHLPF
ncbi:MAG: nucleotidyltransferase family protein [Bacteroidetes bacterium]|nr:nucleotidyltransferase family protein [Bacteroidota bacterium]